MRITMRALPGYYVAYMRYVGPYGTRGIPELCRWIRRAPAARPSRGRDSFRSQLCLPVRAL
jgi:hypothetical protein